MSLADLMKKGSLRTIATLTVATAATVRPASPLSVASVATVTVASTPKQAAIDPAAVTHDLNCWCWPASEAMNTVEVDVFTTRLAHFTGKRLPPDAAEDLADKLLQRDRHADERRLCLECVHLAGYAAGAWSCRNWQQAELSTHSRDALLSPSLVHLLQRCNGFKEI